MRSLSFRREYVTAILQGEKRATLRKSRPLYEIGDHVAAKASREQFATLEVTGIEFTAMGMLTEDDARADGFDTLAELLEVLRQLYPEVSSFWRTTFRVVAVGD